MLSIDLCDLPHGMTPRCSSRIGATLTERFMLYSCGLSHTPWADFQSSISPQQEERYCCRCRKGGERNSRYYGATAPHRCLDWSIRCSPTTLPASSTILMRFLNNCLSITPAILHHPSIQHLSCNHLPRRAVRKRVVWCVLSSLRSKLVRRALK